MNNRIVLINKDDPKNEKLAVGVAIVVESVNRRTGEVVFDYLCGYDKDGHQGLYYSHCPKCQENQTQIGDHK